MLSSVIGSSSLLVVNALALEERATGGYVQNPSASSSFTMYTGYGSPACGKSATGLTAAINQLAFEAAPRSGADDAYGRRFSSTGTPGPFSPSITGPLKGFNPVQGNQEWYGQTTAQHTNQHEKTFHFDICEDTGGPAAFPGSDSGALFSSACLSGETAANWLAVGRGNKGESHSLHIEVTVIR
ncbi:hypothetical protein CPB84DRAFT_1813047 [Gymnopilus junonius]|uniref:Uncharacterized protein n=1 Tax=Gymnopilus junonius TaxID=109634 RepID=A0A9P5NY45_GYMJU|nr:hypothetical protein CPB84DRAFT_1813047 [Gymnopilus junonius]